MKEAGRGRTWKGLVLPRRALTPPPDLPAGSGGLTPSPPACGPCCWRCTWPSSTCRLTHPAGWTPSSSAPCPCAAWWASRQLWPRRRRQVPGGSGPEGQRSSSDCGGRTDGRTGPEQGTALSCIFLTCLTLTPAQPRAPSPGPAPLLPQGVEPAPPFLPSSNKPSPNLRHFPSAL